MILVGRAPAKINRFLSVGPPDMRGYHPLRTIFQTVGLYDSLTISDETDRDTFECADPDVPPDNTVTRALRFVREAVALPPLAITLSKQIPVQSGLGGGSSDAAAFLRAVPLLLNVPLPEQTIADIAFGIGADVPFFLIGGLARGEGYGERLTPMQDTPPEWFLIAKPDIGCSTVDAYNQLDRIERSWKPFPGNLEPYNDFERVAPSESLELIDWMIGHGAASANLCGSGSAVFGLFGSESHASDASSICPHTNWVCRNISRPEALKGFTRAC